MGFYAKSKVGENGWNVYSVLSSFDIVYAPSKDKLYSCNNEIVACGIGDAGYIPTSNSLEDGIGECFSFGELSGFAKSGDIEKIVEIARGKVGEFDKMDRMGDGVFSAKYLDSGFGI